MSDAIRRIITLEREITYESVKGLDVDPWPMIVHAETRARTLSREYVPDPMLIVAGRDRLRDMREEAADGRNHGVFEFEEHPEIIGTEYAHDLMIAMRHFALAYDRLRKATKGYR